MATMILVEKPAVAELATTSANIQNTRAMDQAKLAAKTELISMATAIDNAAAAGSNGVTYKFSRNISKLEGVYREAAMEIINADIAAAEYSVKETAKGLEITWGEEAEEGGDEPSEPADEEPAIESPEDLGNLIEEHDEIEVTLNNDMAFTAPITIAEGKKATIHLNDIIENNTGSYKDEQNKTIWNPVFDVDGGELVIDGEGEVTGAGLAIRVSNGGSATINGGTFTSTSAGQTIAALGEGSVVTINDATVNAQEAAVMAFDGGELVLNGGDYNTIDNFVVGTNGTVGRGGNTIHLKNVTLNGNITSNGYIACGIYAANNDTIIVDEGTEINVTNGCGICQRGGNVIVKAGAKITTTADENFIPGGVGDKKKNLNADGIIFDEEANYPGHTGMSLVVEEGAIFDVAGENVKIYPLEGVEPNVIIA